MCPLQPGPEASCWLHNLEVCCTPPGSQSPEQSQGKETAIVWVL